MSKFHSSVRDILEDTYRFLSDPLLDEILTCPARFQKDNLISQLNNFHDLYPELQLQFSSSSINENNLKEEKREDERCSSSSPIPYVDMNGGSRIKVSSSNEDSYDIVKSREAVENPSVAESEDYTSEDVKCLPDVAASDLYACEKSGYLDKKKRDSIKGWLNPFQKRWCAIKDGVLYYFEKTTDRKQKGCIILSGYEARPVFDYNKDGKKYNHCFELVCPGKRTYQFLAASEKDLIQWVQAVQQINKILDTGKSNLEIHSVNEYKDQIVDSLHVAEDIYETVDEDSEKKSDAVVEDKREAEEDYSDTDVVKNLGLFNYDEWYVGLWDCCGSDESELSFYRGDLIHIISKEYDSYAWWIGELQGKIGFVPKSYLMEAYEAC